MVDLVSLRMALVPRIYLDFTLFLLLVFFTLSSFFFFYATFALVLNLFMTLIWGKFIV